MNTDYFEIETNQGNIWCAYDYEQNLENAPLVIIAPGYEKTARDALSFSSYFVLNGFRVLRFDARNSTGLSTGVLEDFTLSSLTEDIKDVTEYAAKKLMQESSLSLVAFSLSARALIKYLSRISPTPDYIKAAIAIVGVVDTSYTIEQINGFDSFGDFAKGARFGVRKMLTYDIDWDHFVQDSFDNGYDSLETALEDAKHIDIPYYGSIMTSEDEWISPKHQEVFHNALRNCVVEQYLIEGASHKIWKNPKSAELAIKNSVRIIAKYTLNRELSADQVLKPDITDVISRNRQEREVMMNWK